jgi:hypothetical protein
MRLVLFENITPVLVFECIASIDQSAMHLKHPLEQRILAFPVSNILASKQSIWIFIGIPCFRNSSIRHLKQSFCYVDAC